MYRNFRSKSSGKPQRKTNAAQAMVEFALALPVLLLVVYGLIESGRLLFIYASVVTAARQAVRYGSTTGCTPTDCDSGGTPYYNDCSGIRAAAKNVGFIQRFNDSDIQISYDHGPGGGSISSTCTGTVVVANNDRIRVVVSAAYSPIVPLVPFQPFTITSSSWRTLLVSIPIGVDSPPLGWQPGAGITLQVSPVSSSTYNPYYAAVGDIITYTYTITNNGTTTLSPPYQISDNKATGITCSGADIPPSGSVNCTGRYTITQVDLDNGNVTSIASATAGGFTSTSITTAVLAVTFPRLSLTKSPSPSVAPTVGQTVTYTYTLQNTGNVTLSSPITVSDNKIASVSCPGAGASIAPGNNVTCTGYYTITSADINSGAVTNVATASAQFGIQTITSPQASATVATKPLFLSISASPLTVTGINQIIHYTYTLKNTGTSPLTSPYTISDSKASTTCSGATSPLEAGNVTTCDGTYTTTQADVDAGMVTNLATATAQSSGGPVTSNQVSASVSITQTPQITLSISASPTLATTAGTAVSYTYTLQNSGNVTLSGPFTITDDKVSPVDCSGAPGTLAPGATANNACTGSYVITQSNIDNDGSVIDHATVTGKTPSGGNITSPEATATVITYNAPRLSLLKSANPTLVTGVGQTITYTYTLKNTGNTDLTSPFSVTDDKISAPNSVNCSSAISPIPVGGSTTCTATYTVTSGDETAGSITNHATATAFAGAQQLTSNQATSTVAVAVCDPRHSAFPPVPFSFNMTIFNRGSITLTISNIIIYYNFDSNPNQHITQLTLGGITIWSGASAHSSPVSFNTFSGNVTVSAGSNKILNVSFNKGYVVNSTERILVYFAESACGSTFLDSSNSSQLP